LLREREMNTFCENEEKHESCCRKREDFFHTAKL